MMKLIFAKPITPRHIRVENLTNTIPIQDLDEDDFEEYVKLWENTIRDDYAFRKQEKMKGSCND